MNISVQNAFEYYRVTLHYPVHLQAKEGSMDEKASSSIKQVLKAIGELQKAQALRPGRCSKNSNLEETNAKVCKAASVLDQISETTGIELYLD